jgi:hypothetical protein
VPVGGIDVEHDVGHVLAQPWVVVRLDPHAHGRAARADGVAVQLGDADLAGLLGCGLLEPDQPDRQHAGRVGARPQPGLDHPGGRGVQAAGGLGRPHGETGTVTVGPPVGAGRAGERPGLDVGHPQLLAVGQPRRLVGVDAQRQDAGIQVVAGRGAFWRAPLRQVLRDPPVGGQGWAGEVLLEHNLIAGAVEGVGVRVGVHQIGMSMNGEL